MKIMLILFIALLYGYSVNGQSQSQISFYNFSNEKTTVKLSDIISQDLPYLFFDEFHIDEFNRVPSTMVDEEKQDLLLRQIVNAVSYLDIMALYKSSECQPDLFLIGRKTYRWRPKVQSVFVRLESSLDSGCGVYSFVFCLNFFNKELISGHEISGYSEFSPTGYTIETNSEIENAYSSIFLYEEIHTYDEGVDTFKLSLSLKEDGKIELLK